MSSTAYDDQYSMEPGSFERQHRYIVVKLKDLTPVQKVALECHLDNHGTPTRECVVVESDWSIYEQTWDAVQRLAEGRPQHIAELEAERDRIREKVATWKGLVEDNQAIALSVIEERDALAAQAQRLNGKLADIKDALYGQGFEVAGWHLNGDLQSMDSWFEENDWDPEDAPVSSTVDAKALATSVLHHCYGRQGIDTRMIEQTAEVIERELTRQKDGGNHGA